MLIFTEPDTPEAPAEGVFKEMSPEDVAEDEPLSSDMLPPGPPSELPDAIRIPPPSLSELELAVEPPWRDIEPPFLPPADVEEPPSRDTEPPLPPAPEVSPARNAALPPSPLVPLPMVR